MCHLGTRSWYFDDKLIILMVWFLRQQKISVGYKIIYIGEVYVWVKSGKW